MSSSCDIVAKVTMKPNYTEALHFNSDVDITGWGLTCVGVSKHTRKEVFRYTVGHGIKIVTPKSFTITVTTPASAGDIEFDIRFAPNDGAPEFPSPTYEISVCKGMS